MTGAILGPEKVHRLEGKYAEIRCIHSYTATKKFHVRAYGWEMYCCSDCFKKLINLMNQVLLFFDEEESFRVSDLGVFCDRCEERKMGRFFRLHEFGFIKVVDTIEGKTFEHWEVKEKRVNDKVYCNDCWKELERRKGLIVTTSRDIYLPHDMDDQVVASLWGRGLEKTDKEFTLVPTPVLRSMLSALGDKKPKELEEKLEEVEREVKQ